MYANVLPSNASQNQFPPINAVGEYQATLKPSPTQNPVHIGHFNKSPIFQQILTVLRDLEPSSSHLPLEGSSSDATHLYPLYHQFLNDSNTLEVVTIEVKL